MLGEWMSCGRNNVHRKLFEGESKARSDKVILTAGPRGRAIGRFPIHESAAKYKESTDHKKSSLRNTIRDLMDRTRIAMKLYHSLLSNPYCLVEMEKLSV